MDILLSSRKNVVSKFTKYVRDCLLESQATLQRSSAWYFEYQNQNKVYVYVKQCRYYILTLEGRVAEICMFE